MIIGLIVTMTLIGYTALRISKYFTKEFALLPLIIMVGLDVMAILVFKDFLLMERKDLALGILFATLVKVFLFIAMMPKEKIIK